MKHFYIIILCISSLFISCSSNSITEEDVCNSKKELIADINKISTDGFISQLDSVNAIKNIISFEQSSFLGKYWWIIVFVILWFVIIGLLDEFTDTSLKRDVMKKPESKLKGYMVLFGSGIFGGHYFYYDKFKWIGWLTILLTLVIPLWDFKEIMYFYNIPNLLFIQELEFIHLPGLGLFYLTEIILFSLYAFNILSGLLCIPYWVYLYNSKYFRKHTDNDDILKGKKLEVDKFYNQQLTPNIIKTNEDADEVKETLADDELIIYNKEDDKLSGFFKSIFTLGNSSTLKYKVGRLRALRYCCQVLSEDIDRFETDNDRLYYFLSYYRIAAYRNLYLAKELVGIVKDKVSSKKQSLIKDDFPDIVSPQNDIPENVYASAISTSFDSDSFWDSVGTSLGSSFDNLSLKLDKEGNLSKDDFIGAAIEVGIDSVIAAIDGVLTMNSRTNRALRDVEYDINKAVSYLNKALPAINKYQIELLRQSELMVALSQCNRAFVMAYEPIRQKVFGRPSFRQFIFGVNKDLHYLKTDEFKKDLQHLLLVCSEYNKVYNAKTGNDSNRIRKPDNITKKSSKASKTNSDINTVEEKCSNVVNLSREDVLAIIRQALNNEHINEGNSIAFLELQNRESELKVLCQKLNELSRKTINEYRILNCDNIKDVIDLTIK